MKELGRRVWARRVFVGYLALCLAFAGGLYWTWRVAVDVGDVKQGQRTERQQRHRERQQARRQRKRQARTIGRLRAGVRRIERRLIPGGLRVPPGARPEDRVEPLPPPPRAPRPPPPSPAPPPPGEVPRGGFELDLPPIDPDGPAGPLPELDPPPLKVPPLLPPLAIWGLSHV